jgi:hypothetical protein
MKQLIIATLLACAVFPSFAMGAERVNGYMKQNGTYVAPHWRSESNSTRNDNYTTKGNSNPYNGNKGYEPRANGYNNNNWGNNNDD